MIEVKELQKHNDLKWRAKDQQSGSEIADLKFVVEQKSLKIREQESEILRLKEEITSGGSGGSGIQMTSGLNPSNTAPAEARPALGDDTEAKHWAEELRKSDEALAELREKMRSLENENFSLLEKVRHGEKGIEARDVEIQRLGNLYTGGQNIDTLNAEYVIKTNEETLRKL